MLLLIALLGCRAPWEEVPFSGTTEELVSTVIGETYTLYVRLPEGYDDEPERAWPLVVYLDGDWSRYAYDLEVPEADLPPFVSVGIGYGGRDPRDLRARDYVYPHDPNHADDFPTTGDGDRFYEFLRDDLVPHVEERWRVDPAARTLQGHSYGGYFAMYAFFRGSLEGDGLFDHFVAASASLHMNEGWLLGQEEALAAAAPAELPGSVFLSVGEYESVHMNVYFDVMGERLTDRGYTGFRYQGMRYPRGTHGSVATPSILDGLAFTFEAP